MNTSEGLHALQQEFRNQAPKLLQNSFSERVFGITQATEILQGLSQENNRLTELFEYFSRNKGLQSHVSGNYFDIPERGPLIVAANHPTGPLDGVVLGRLIEKRRKQLLYIIIDSPEGIMPEVSDNILYRGYTREQKLLAFQKMMIVLGFGGCIIIFPSGKVTHNSLISGMTQESGWNRGVLTLARKSKAPIVPIHLESESSGFTNASRAMLGIEKTRSLIPRAALKNNTSIDATIGTPLKNVKAMKIKELQEAIYSLGNNPYELNP